MDVAALRRWLAQDGQGCPACGSPREEVSYSNHMHVLGEYEDEGTCHVCGAEWGRLFALVSVGLRDGPRANATTLANLADDWESRADLTPDEHDPAAAALRACARELRAALAGGVEHVVVLPDLSDEAHGANAWELLPDLTGLAGQRVVVRVAPVEGHSNETPR